HFWAILLSSSILGGLPVALPEAMALSSKHGRHVYAPWCIVCVQGADDHI
ncbi:hypothetical protein C5S36_04975, partial [Candidatus Methanophagaceae archaeon]